MIVPVLRSNLVSELVGVAARLSYPPAAKQEAGMTEQQFTAILTHLRIIIVFLGFAAGPWWPSPGR